MGRKHKSIAAAISVIIILSSCGSAINSESPSAGTETEISKSTSAISAEAFAETFAEAPKETAAQNTAVPSGGELLSSVRDIIGKEFKNAVNYRVSAGLFDFDLDGVPEVYAVRSNGGQGFMPIAVYSLDGRLLGELSGYCRDGYTRFYINDGNVYMENFYEHSYHQRVFTIDRIICENGGISSAPVVGKTGLASDRFPILEYTYYADGEETDEKTFSDRYSEVYWEANKSTVVNGASIFADRGFTISHDASSENYPSEMAEYICEVYRSYENGKAAAAEYTGRTPDIYAFDDYDSDGIYEAFVQAEVCAPELYFWDGSEITQLTEPNGLQYFLWFQRVGKYFIAQPLGNSNPCKIFGVKDSKPYEHELSDKAMSFNYSVYSEYTIGDFFLEDSDWEPSHTHKSYLFDADFNERKGVPVTAEYFADDELVYNDVKAAFLQTEAEGGRIEGAYLRGERYLNINYSYPALEDMIDGFRLTGYKTYIVQNYVTLIDEGAGNYKESIPRG